MTDKRQHRTPRNRARRIRRSVLCLSLLAALCAPTLTSATAFATEETLEKETVQKSAEEATDVAPDEAITEDYGIATLATDFTRSADLGYLTDQVITQEEFYALFDAFMKSDCVQNTVYSSDESDFAWGYGTRWDCSAMVFYFVTYFLVPYCDDGVAVKDLPTRCENYSDFLNDGDLWGTSTYAQITHWGKIIYTEEDIANGTISEDNPGNLKPGDLIYYGASSNQSSTSGNVSHVAMYLGDGQFLQSRNGSLSYIPYGKEGTGRTYQSGKAYQVECLANASTATDGVEGRGDGARTSSFRLTQNANDEEKGYPAIAVVRIFDSVESGYLTLEKCSGDKSITEGNSCYSLSGAVYTVYTDKACTNAAKDMTGKTATLTTDANGNANTVELALGTYYVKETTAPPGYRTDDTIRTVEITTEHTEKAPYRITCSDTPLYDTLGLSITKVDLQSGQSTPQGSATLAGAQFTISFYPGAYTKDDIVSLTPTRTWVIETQEEGGEYRALLDEAHFISGDVWYTVDGQIVLPLGTYTIQETKAPIGYLIEGTFTDGAGTSVAAGDIYWTQLTGKEDTTTFTGGNTFTAADRVKRADVMFQKQDGGDQSTIGPVAFRLTSVTTGESHVFWTDENGEYSSAASWVPHTQHTNAGESPEDGLWFYGTSDWEASAMTVDDALGALPYDTYLLEELPCDANAGYTLITTSFTVYRDVMENGELFGMVNLGTIDDYEFGFSTKATDAKTGNKNLEAAENVTIQDTISYWGINRAETYTFVTELFDVTTGEPLLDESGEILSFETEFTAKTTNGTAEVLCTIDATDLSGHTLVLFESLYDVEGTLIRLEADANEGEQSVTFTGTTPPVKTGDTTEFASWIVVVAAAGTALLLLLIRWIRGKQKI